MHHPKKTYRSAELHIPKKLKYHVIYQGPYFAACKTWITRETAREKLGDNEREKGLAQLRAARPQSLHVSSLVFGNGLMRSVYHCHLILVDTMLKLQRKSTLQ